MTHKFMEETDFSLLNWILGRKQTSVSEELCVAYTFIGLFLACFVISIYSRQRRSKMILASWLLNNLVALIPYGVEGKWGSSDPGKVLLRVSE